MKLILPLQSFSLEERVFSEDVIGLVKNKTNKQTKTKTHK